MPLLGTFWGTGFQLLHYRPAGAGRFQVQRWFTVLFVPVVPAGTFLIEPRKLESVHLGVVVGERTSFLLHARVQTVPVDVLRVYGAAIVAVVVALGPLAAVFHYARPSNPTPWPIVALLLASAVWPVVVLGWVNSRWERHYDG